MNINDWIEEMVEKTEKDIYNGDMPAHNKESLRKLLLKEHEFWMRFDNRVDNNTGHDDQ